MIAPTLLAGEQRGGDDHLLDRLVGRLLAIEVPEERRLAEVRERATDVGLEQHDGGKRHVEQHVPDEPVQRLQRRQLRDIEQQDDEQRSGRHLDRTRARISLRNS